VLHQHIVAASVACTSARWLLLEDIVRAARSAKVRRPACEEALLQCYLFAGYPRAIEALSLLQRRWPRRRRARGLPGAKWQAHGERLCRRVYGRKFERVRAHMTAAHPDLSRWMITEGYGKVLSRPGLDPVSRELCALASLAALPAPRQLDAHVRGALRVGAQPEQIRHALALVALGCATRTWRSSQRRAEQQLADWSARNSS
jgi:4-carboxymuconolactone decarboxylase